MSSSTVKNLRAPRNRELDRKTPTPPPRTRAEIDTARVARPAATSECPATSSETVFEARAWARATLYAACIFDLRQAVDELQAWAEATGLVDEIGQNRVQSLIARAFEAVR